MNARRKAVRFRRRPVGVFYCIRHEGVMNEDDHWCDFAEHGELNPVTLDPLVCKPRRCFIVERVR